MYQGERGLTTVPDDTSDYYDVLQISATADPEMVHRVYRLLAQRFHPDNRETGDADHFLLIQEAYKILSDPERRAHYDAETESLRRKPRQAPETPPADNEFELERSAR